MGVGVGRESLRWPRRETGPLGRPMPAGGGGDCLPVQSVADGWAVARQVMLLPQVCNLVCVGEFGAEAAMGEKFRREGRRDDFRRDPQNANKRQK